MEIIFTQMVGIYNMTLFGRFSAFTLFLSEIQAAWVLQRSLPILQRMMPSDRRSDKGLPANSNSVIPVLVSSLGRDWSPV